MAAASARHLFFLAAMVAVAAPRAADAWGGGRFFFSKTTRPAEATVEPDKATVPSNAVATDTDAAPAFSRPSTAGSGGRGYGLYGRPEENYPPDYFRRGVHRNAEKLTTTTTTDVPATAGTMQEAAPIRGRGAGGEHVGTTFPEDGSGRGRPPTDVPVTTTGTEEVAVPAGGAGGGDLDGVQPYPEDGSGRGRPPWYYTGFRGGSRQQEQEQEQRDYGMSDTRLYQNGRYYYDVDAGRYGYGRESNPMRRTRPADEVEEFGSGSGSGSGYGRPRGAGGRRYGDEAGYRQRQQYGNGEEFGNGAMDRNTNGFQEEAGQDEYIP